MVNPADEEATPSFVILNFVTPLEEAARRSPLLVLLTIREALLPIPPDIERGDGVVALPTNTDESESDERIRFPVPFGVRVRLSSPTVVIAAAELPPNVRVVESIERVGEASIVVSAPAVIVVRPVAERIVSDESIVRVLFPLSSVRVFAPPD